MSMQLTSNLKSLTRISVTALLVLGLAGCASASERTVTGLPEIRLGTSTDNEIGTDSGTDSGMNDESPAATQSPDSESGEQEYAYDPRAEIDIDDQSGDGSRIILDEISVGRNNAYLVIYDSRGQVLATALVTPFSQPVSILLNKPLTVSQELQAALYLDDGDGNFELDEDQPLIGEENKLAHEDFDYRVTG